MFQFRRSAQLTLAACAILLYALAFQGSRSLWEPDEGRYTDVAVQMLRTGDYLAPALNDDVPHFTKPPLTYWAIAGGISWLGWNEWGVRLANALAFAATIFVVFLLARRIVPDRPWLPPLIYSSFLMPFVAANVVTTDTLLTLWEAVAVLGFAEWWARRDGAGALGALLLLWGGFGLGFLTKGPPALLPLLAILVFVGLALGWRALPRVTPLAGVATFLIVGLAWYLAVATTHPGLLHYFVSEEVVHRLTSSSFNRNAEWYGGFRIYLPVLIGGTLPWTFAWLRAARSLPRTLLARAWWSGKLEQDPWPAFLALWVLLPLTVFWISRSRLPLYILPLFVPLALGTARLTGPFHGPQRRARAGLLAGWFLMLLALKWAGGQIPSDRESRSLALAILTHAGNAPTEVVFVDARPLWGLSLYLQCEVERVTASMTATDEDTLAEELEEAEPGTVFLVRKEQSSPIQAALDPLGYSARELVTSRSWILMAPLSTPPDTPPPHPATQLRHGP